MGVKVSKNMAITAGSLKVTNKGYGSRGVKVDGQYYKEAAATVTATVYDVKNHQVYTMPPMD